MLATMRPVQHYSQGLTGDSRSTSRNSNYSNNGSPSINRATPSKLSRSNSGSSNGSHHKKAQSSASTTMTTRSSKKATAAHSSLSNEVEAVEMTKPGLITLSKPLNGGGKKGNNTGEGVKAPKPSRKKKGPALLDEIKGNEEELLSRSAPVTSNKGQGEWDMPSHRAEGVAAEASLNWQQEMIASTPEKKKTGKKAAGNKNGIAQSNAVAPAKDSLTWQQELLGNNKPRGPTFDVFADARDVATFGSAGEERRKEPKTKKQGGASSAGNRKRAGSVGELAKHLPSKPAPSVHGLPGIPIMSSSQSGPVARQESGMPTTPNGKFAYAGPNFHNSPSPASLPVPKFLQQRGGASDMVKSPSTLFAKEAMMRRAANGSGASNDGDTSISSEEWEDDDKKRSIRGATAPPEMQTADKPSVATIQSLLEKMMNPRSD